MLKIGQFIATSSLAVKYTAQKKFLHYTHIHKIVLLFPGREVYAVKKLSNKFTAVREETR